jgi:hypothetical protein
VTMDQSDLDSDSQAPDLIAHMYESGGREEEDNAQILKWEQFLQNSSPQEKENEDNLLRALELCEEDSEMEIPGEEQLGLSQDIVNRIVEVRKIDLGEGLKLCENKGKTKKKEWGPILVNRQIRRHNDGTSMLQRSMTLKQNKNLEPLKGNSFASLHSDALNQLAIDVNLFLGADSLEADTIVNKLMIEEDKKVNFFMEENPEILLPSNLDVSLESEIEVEGNMNVVPQTTDHKET